MLALVVVAAVMAQSALVRSGLAAILGSTPSIRVVAEIGPDGAGVLPSEPIDLVVCDIEDDLPPESVLEHAPKGVPVLALAGSLERSRELLGSGARGVLLRNASAEQLSSASLAVAAGLFALDGAVIERWIGQRPTPAEATVSLTPREHEVLTLMAEGLSNKWIASRLSISEHTVKFHVNSILEKLEADTRTDAVVRAARQGLLTL
jgi:two-component system, NarL family, nitrate/nitrite response regulator NarL